MAPAHLSSLAPFTEGHPMVQAPAPNIPLLWAVLQHIDEQPLSWTQSAWTARGLFGDMHCFAGHAVRLSGHRFTWSAETETCCALDERGLRVYRVAGL